MRLFSFLLMLIGAGHFSTSQAKTLCADLSKAIDAADSGTVNPSRRPTKEEEALIASAKLSILGFNDYAKGVDIVDIDNDGNEDVFAWSIGGSGRFLSAEIHAIRNSNGVKLVERRGSINLGVLQFPRFIRVRGLNFLIASLNGDNTTTYAARFSTDEEGRLLMSTVCQMQTMLEPQSSCRHPACKTLIETIADKRHNEDFVRVEWPHRYLEPAGPSVYFPENPIRADFDNTGQSTGIWRFGRKDHLYQHIYWSLLGQGDEKPAVDDALRPAADNERENKRTVLPGEQHDRLRRTLTEQGVALSNALHRDIALPEQGQFFLFTAHGNRVYWGWDFDEPPSGSSIHIAYTNARQSDYIGTVDINRSIKLLPCESDCVERLQQ